MSFEHQVRLRWSDLDAQGHVNNVLVVDYLQEARVGFLQAGPAAGLLDSGVVVVSHAVEYLAAIEYDTEPVVICLGVAALGASRFEVAYSVVQRGVAKARASTVLCPFDFEAQSPRRLTPDEREYFSGHLVNVEALRTLDVPALAGRGYPTPLNVRWSDLDSYGHVNNVEFFDYVMQARIEATTAIDPAMARTGAGTTAQHTWLVARQDLYYLNQLGHRGAPYTVLTAPVRLGRSSVTLAAEIVDGDVVFGRAATVLVCADLDGRPIELPDDTRGRLEGWLVEN